MARKGITPVIAIVLLLLITVGAVGVVYTQFQSLTGNPSQELEDQKQVQNTEISFSSVYNNDTSQNSDNADTINITVRNTGSVAFDVAEDMNIRYLPDGSSGNGLAYDQFPAEDKITGLSESERCFHEQGGDEVVNPSEEYTCSTGIKFPNAGSSVEIQVSLSGAEKSWSYTCSPSTSSSVTC